MGDPPELGGCRVQHFTLNGGEGPGFIWSRKELQADDEPGSQQEEESVRGKNAS